MNRDVTELIAKIVAAGGSSEKCWLTFQEYFERTQGTPSRWGKPFSALLGAYRAQLELGCGAIGGKDSMSGTFEHIDVPPTLVSFAVSTAKADKIISAEFKCPFSKLYYIAPEYDKDGLPVFESVKKVFKAVEKAIAEGKGGFLRSMWCGSMECELAMKERAGVSSRCMPLAQSGTEGVCPVCGKPCDTDIYWGVAY